MSDIFKNAELGRALREVERVLAFGQQKYPDNKWLTQSIEEVMEHAVGHEELAELGCDQDEESECLNLAHGIVRRLMALDKVLRDNER